MSDGLAAVCLGAAGCGYIDRTGKMVIAPQFKSAARFDRGIAKVEMEHDKVGYIDKSGRLIWKPQR